MNDLPYCGICGKQIVNAPSIGWYCPTINCEGDWPQKANIVFDYKTDEAKLKEAEKEIAELKKKRTVGQINEAYAATIERQDIERQKQLHKINQLNLKNTSLKIDRSKQQSDIKELAEALKAAAGDIYIVCSDGNLEYSEELQDKYQALANKHLEG